MSQRNGSSGVSSVIEGAPRLIEDENILDKENDKEKNAIPKVPFLSLPDKSSTIDLVKLSGPMFFVMLGKIACYGAMSIRATDFDVVNLAAHSIMIHSRFFREYPIQNQSRKIFAKFKALPRNLKLCWGTNFLW